MEWVLTLLVGALAVWCYRLQTRLKQLELRGEQPAPVLPRPVAAMPMAAPDVPLVLVEGPPPTAQPVGPPPLPSAAEVPTPPSPARDWEALIGGNLLNKLGVLVLVIGIALFLGYSLAELGPVGKAAVGCATGLALLAAGVWLERRVAYRTFARGLIGGGWATVYFTGYAVHAVPAVQLIPDPVTGWLLLLAISLAMVGHALSYRSPAAVGLAFGVAFISLNLYPLTAFSLWAALPLAAFVLAAAAHFGSLPLAVGGLVLTYGTHAWQYDFLGAGPELRVAGQLTLWLDWLLFEAFDLYGLRRDGDQLGPLSALLPLNALGFLSLALLSISLFRAGDLPDFYALAAAAFLISAAVRAVSAPATTSGRLVEALVFSGGYELAAILSAAIAAAAIGQRWTGLAADLGWLIEAQIIVVGGLFFRRRFLQWLGAVAFLLPAVALANDLPAPVTFHWTALAVALMVLAYANRYLTGLPQLFTMAGNLAAAALVRGWVPTPQQGLAWLVQAGLLLGVARALGWRECGWQAGLLAITGYCSLVAHHLLSPVTAATVPTVLPAVALLYAAAHWQRSPERLHAAVQLAATLLLTALLAHVLPGPRLTIAFSLESVALLVGGFLLQDRLLRLSGLTLFLICIVKLMLYDLSALDTLSRIFSALILGCLLLAASWAYTRFREQLRRLL